MRQSSHGTSSGLWRQVLPPASHYKQPIELLQQIVRRSFLILQILPFGMADFSLNAILVEVMRQLQRASTQVQPMKMIGETFAEFGLITWIATGLISMYFHFPSFTCRLRWRSTSSSSSEPLITGSQ
jgi:hypothetical protein